MTRTFSGRKFSIGSSLHLNGTDAEVMFARSALGTSGKYKVAHIRVTGFTQTDKSVKEDLKQMLHANLVGGASRG